MAEVIIVPDPPRCPRGHVDTQVTAEPSAANQWRGWIGCHVCKREYAFDLPHGLHVGDVVPTACPRCGFAEARVTKIPGTGWHVFGTAACAYCGHQYAIWVAVEEPIDPTFIQPPRPPRQPTWFGAQRKR
jgi:hypothetical protein